MLKPRVRHVREPAGGLAPRPASRTTLHTFGACASIPLGGPVRGSWRAPRRYAGTAPRWAGLLPFPPKHPTSRACTLPRSIPYGRPRSRRPTTACRCTTTPTATTTARNPPSALRASTRPTASWATRICAGPTTGQVLLGALGPDVDSDSLGLTGSGSVPRGGGAQQPFDSYSAGGSSLKNERSASLRLRRFSRSPRFDPVPSTAAGGGDRRTIMRIPAPTSFTNGTMAMLVNASFDEKSSRNSTTRLVALLALPCPAPVGWLLTDLCLCSAHPA